MNTLGDLGGLLQDIEKVGEDCYLVGRPGKWVLTIGPERIQCLNLDQVCRKAQGILRDLSLRC